MAAFLSSLFFIAIAEMGDKTQLVTLAFASRYSARLVLAGIFVATLLVHLFSVGIGEVLGIALPEFWLKIAAGIAFIGFGLWTIRGDSLDEEEGSKPNRFGPFMTVAVTFFIAELGDKTMLTTITLASQYRDFVPVWLGSTIGMVFADGLAVIVAAVAGKNLPEKLIRYVAALIFLGSGVFTLWEAFAGQ